MPRLDFYSAFKLFVTVRLEDAIVSIGRSNECTIQLPAANISRLHATIEPAGNGRYRIYDKSTNGTRVNHTQIEGSSLLEPGDRIYIGDYILVYQPNESPPEDFGNERTMGLK